jgi:hypothetical protein
MQLQDAKSAAPGKRPRLAVSAEQAWARPQVQRSVDWLPSN